MRATYANKKIPIAKGCTVSFEKDLFTFKGELGEETYDVSSFKFTFEICKDSIVIHSWHAKQKSLQLLNTIASHIRNCMEGVTVGFKLVLRSVFRHFPIQVNINPEGSQVKVSGFIGSKEERVYNMRGKTVALPGDVKDTIFVQGTHIEDVTQSAANIISDSLRRKKHDERVFIDGIFIQQKTSIIIN